MIRIRATLHPYGLSRGNDLVAIAVWSEPDNKHHGYRIDFLDGRELGGEVPKESSGHQNILHVLRDILNTADLDSLGKDYIQRGGVVEEK